MDLRRALGRTPLVAALPALFILFGSAPCAAQVFNMANGATWNSCSGDFYDSGGQAANYANGETMNATLCPTGGAGSGPATSLVFNVWGVSALGLTDQLVIHNGTTTAGAVLGTGSGLVSIQGQTFTSTDPSGCLTFEWTSDLLVDQPGWEAHILTGPDAGIDGAVTLCRTSASINLFTYLGGTPDVGGTWTAPGGAAHAATFNPASDVAGIYTYTVAGSGSCPSATATVTVTLNDPPSAGTNGTLSVCSNGAPVDLFTRLGGTPEASGAWTFGGSPVSNIFTPGTSTPGTYTYTVNGIPPCANATATVTVTQVAAPNAGTDRSITVCSSDAPFSMRGQLGGTPQAGGTWTGSHPDQFNPATENSAAFTYTVTGTAPCANATATLTITVRPAPHAGTSASMTVCSTDADFDLFTVLTGTPDVGGTWTAPGGAAHSNQFQPGVDVAGAYTYTVTGQSPCAPATATVTVTVRTAPNAGTSSSVVKCSNAASFSLFSLLGGTPQSGGQWKDPAMVNHSATFVPGTDAPGLYTYIVTGTAPCANAQATVNVTVVAAPNAGTDGSNTVCSSAPAFSLFASLGGSPDAGGSWTAPGGAAFPSGTFVPGTSTPGIYTYTVAGTSPCANDVSTVTVTVVQAADAGTNGTVTLCSNNPTEPLFPHLGGTPNTGGAWTKPNGTAFNGSYNPSDPSCPAGIYTYTVTGTTPCPNASATVQVVENQAPNAGNNISSATCSTNAPFALFNLITGNPDAGGTWRNVGNVTMNGTFTPGTTPAGPYRYVVTGTAPCANDTATVTISVSTAPNAGTNGSTSVCSNAASFQLFPLLGGTPDAGGSWRNPQNQSSTGTYVPGTSLEGAYTYTVTGTPPCANEISVVTVNEERRPVAGTNGTLEVCSTDPSVDLFTRLGGTPDAGGSWSGPGGASSGVFIPGVSAAGLYTYTVNGTAPCANATATVSVTVNQAPDAGTNGTLTVCADQSSVDLMTGLGGTPDSGGTWDDQDHTGQLSGQFFSPLGLPPGDYHFEYTVTGNGQCSDDEADVVVTIVSQLEAGSNGSASICGSQTNADLFIGLAGSPQQGGTWTDLDNTGAVTGHFFNASVVPAGTYHFRYDLTGTLSCASDFALATITVVQAPNAGINGNAVFCSNGPSTGLFSYLGGSPQSGGIWRKPDLSPFSGVYNPVLDNAGVYSYRVAGTPPCAADTGFVTVTETTAPNAGQPAAITICADEPPFSMTSRLGGTPSPSGTWTTPSGQNHSATFTPGLDAPGVYIYTVTGTFPCTNGIATLTISVNQPAFAGNDVSITVCSNGDPFVLFGVLTGNPQSGGTWKDPHGAPFPSGVYTPGTSEPGTYTYRVNGQPPCGSDMSSVTVFESAAADAGTSTSVALCANGGAVTLFTELGGSPDPTGTWRRPGGGGFGGIFQPGTSTPGVYSYIVAGIPPCVNDTATVNVVVNAPPNAGTSVSVVRCSTDAPFALVGQLGGSPALNGSWTGPNNQPHNGIFTPGTSTAGTYTYTVQGVSPCAPATATVTVTVNTAPNAGSNGNITLCSTSGQVSLFASLGGTPQAGGTWTGPGNVASSGNFLPSVDAPGVYTYTVTGLAPCSNATATVTVTVNQAPHAGSNGLRTVCDDEFPFPLLNVLSGNPGLNGTWTDPHGVAMNGIFVPGVSEPGVYTYTVSGAAPCANSSAQATIIENTAPDAGGDGVVSVCSSQAPFQLIAHLQGTPDATGTWRSPNGQSFSGTFVPSTSPGGIYTYVVAGLAPCVNDTSHVTVVLNAAPNAGVSTAPLVCTSRAPFALLDLLGGTPATNGTWTGPSGAHGPVFDPAVDISGTYTYTVTGVSPCTNATANVQVTLVPASNAGDDGALSACVSDASVALFPALGGTPQAGGTWSTTDAQGHLANGIFNATGVAPGVYHFTYTVTGASPCPNDQALVTVTVTDALDAGADAAAQVCNSSASIVLFDLLGGQPQPGGTWTDLNGSGGLVNGVLNAQQTGTGVFHYRYVLYGSSNCPGDTAVLTITVLAGPRAGDDGFAALCSNQQPPINLFSLLGGTHDNNGHWTTDEGAPHGSTFDPQTELTDTLYYIVPAIGSCAADTAVVRVNVSHAPNAGIGGSLAFCSNGAQQPLVNGLGGAPDPGGSWTGPGNVAHGPNYNPAIDVPGQYTYTVLGDGICPNATAGVGVTEQPAPFAGTDNSYSACSSQAPFSLFSHLAGSPQSGGTWSGPSGAHGPTFDPATDQSGVYHYVVAGIAPCLSDEALLTITVTEAPDAGQDSTLGACISSGPVDLFPALGANADTGGTWTDNNATGALTGSVFAVTDVDPGTYTFTYTVPGSGPCLADNAMITVNVGAGANPGVGSTDTICGGETAYDLFLSLSGTPDMDGVWEDGLGTGALDGHFVNASILTPGNAFTFRYTVTDASCGDAFAVVELFITPFADPGADSTVSICAGSSAFSLFQALSGNPDAGGTWTNPNGFPTDATFTPGTDAAGVYTYLLHGTAPCGDTTAQVTVQVNQPANAGVAGAITACDTGSVDLITVLGGTPQPNGTWTDLDASGGLSGGTLDVSGLSPGSYRFRYTVTVAGCSSANAIATVQVIDGVAVGEVERTCNEQDRTYTVQFTITGGDPATYTVTGMAGAISTTAPYVFTSDPIITSQSFHAIVNDGHHCTPDTVAGVSPCDFTDDVFVPESFTPNGDGINDRFVIPGIEGYPNNTVSIFNRWGSEVYSAAGYDNHAVVWDGTCVNALMPGDLPTGTYYYVVELGDGVDPVKGYVYLNR